MVNEVWLKLVPVGLANGESMVHVLAIGARVGKFLVTFGALEGLLAGVKAFVLGEVVFVFKRFRTLQTFVWALT